MSEKGLVLIEKLKSMGLTPDVLSTWMIEYDRRKDDSEPYAEEVLTDLEDAGCTKTITLEEFQDLGNIKTKDEGGVYHDGGTFWRVIRFEKFEINLGCKAIYSSWDTSRFDRDWIEVEPKEVTFTVTKWYDEKGHDLDTEL